MCTSYSSTLFSALVIYFIYSGIKDYGKMNCATPIETWFIGNLFVVLSTIMLVDNLQNLGNFPPFIMIAWIFSLIALVLFIPIWNMLGTYWIIKNLILGNKCLEPISVFLILAGQGMVYFLYLSLFAEGWKKLRAMRKSTEQMRLIGKTLDEMYKGEKQMSKPELTRFISTNQTILEKMNILDIEKEIIKQHCSTLVTEDNPANECTICLSPLEKDQMATRIGCEHLFHYNCLTEWFKMKPNCPICRKPFRPAMLELYLENIDPENRA